jgi:hypothetical protein
MRGRAALLAILVGLSVLLGLLLIFSLRGKEPKRSEVNKAGGSDRQSSTPPTSTATHQAVVARIRDSAASPDSAHDISPAIKAQLRKRTLGYPIVRETPPPPPPPGTPTIWGDAPPSEPRSPDPSNFYNKQK